MTNKKTLSIYLLILAVFFIARPCLAQTKDLTIVFSGDMRGELENCHCPKDDFGGLSRRAEYIAEVQEVQDDVLLLDVGDVLPLRTPDIDDMTIKYDAFISFKAMDIMGYDAMNIGESDLILGEGFLEQKTENLSFPLISANIVDKYTGSPHFRPYVIKTMKNGLRVGILGLLNQRYVINSDKLDTISYIETADRYVEDLKSESDIVIVLGHLGLPYSEHLAEAVEGIDVILNGHWDVDSQEPKVIGKTLVMSTTFHSRKIGRLDLKIKDSAVTSYTWESTLLDEEYDGNLMINNLVSQFPSKVGEASKVNFAMIEKLADQRPLMVSVFYSPGCRACMEVDRDVLPGIEEKYGQDILIKHYDVSLTNNYEQMVRLEKLYGIEGGYVPEVIVARNVLMGKEDITLRLDDVIEKALAEPPDSKKNSEIKLEAVQYQAPASSIILSRFESLSVYAVMAAGLLDGVNPCAFTTIVFFISFLAFVGYKRREMFFAGLSFAFAVFITYLLIGLGIFRFLRAMHGFHHITLILNIFIAGLALLLGGLSLVDYFRYRKNKDSKDVVLKLPQAIKNRIHSVIGADFRDKKSGLLRIIWVAFSAGFIVSILESFCTGQVYLPTIAFVLRMTEKKISAFSYLVLYNLSFILPLIAVLFLGLFGATSKTFTKFMQNRLGLVKLATAALFLFLGATLLIFSW